MACEAPIEWQLGLRKPCEFPIEEQPELKKPKSESAEQEEEEDEAPIKADENDEVSIEEDENDEVSTEEDENDEVSTEEDENDEVPMELDEEYWRDDDLYAEDENGLHEMNPNECGEYFYHLNKSGGFDMPEFPNAIFYGIQPNGLSDAREYVDVKNCSIFATKEHNKEKGTNYEFYRLVKVNDETVSGTFYYITYLAEDLNNKLDSESGSLENVHVGLHGGQLIELQAKVFLPLPVKDDKMELMYFNVKDTLSDEGVQSHMEFQARKKKLAVTK